MIERRMLGRTCLSVPVLGLGGAGLGGSAYGPVPESEAIALVQEALAHGVDFIDTSPLYGDSERRLGIALQGVDRDRYLLSTKTGTHPDRRGDYSGDATRWSVENSLRQLGTDYVDLCLIHDPSDLSAALAPGGALDMLETLRAEGKLRFIGLGVRSHALLHQAIDTGRIDVVLTHSDHHPLRTTALSSGLLAAAHAARIGVINGSPLAGGRLAIDDPARRGHEPWIDIAVTRFHAFCQERGVSPVGVAIAFSRRQPLLPMTLIGPKNPHELAETLLPALQTYPAALWDDLADLDLETEPRAWPHS
jgi:aryl-alcohol dehydrogenase-like predicted oxidoreductase